MSGKLVWHNVNVKTVIVNSRLYCKQSDTWHCCDSQGHCSPSSYNCRAIDWHAPTGDRLWPVLCILNGCKTSIHKNHLIRTEIEILSACVREGLQFSLLWELLLYIYKGWRIATLQGKPRFLYSTVCQLSTHFYSFIHFKCTLPSYHIQKYVAHNFGIIGIFEYLQRIVSIILKHHNE